MYVLLYSKYSRSCLRLLDNIEQLNGMTTPPMVQLVCIDSKQTRKQILNSKAIEIKKVPCLLILEDTSVEKYDGERAFQWVGEVVKKIISQQTPPPPPPPQQTRIQVKPDDEEEVPPPPPPPPQRKKKPSKKKETNIEDLDDDEEQNSIKRPPIPIRNGAGSYSIDDDMFEQPSEEESRVNKTSGTSSKGAGILDIAFAMRQEREKENKDINK